MLTPLLTFCSGPATSAATVTTQPPTPAPATAPVTAPATVLYINEVLAHTDEPQVDSLELYNPNAAAVDLTGWCISDRGRKSSIGSAFPQAEAAIAAHGYVVLNM